VLLPMLLKTVSRNTVSLENSRLPVLGVVSKSSLHELKDKIVSSKTDKVSKLERVDFKGNS